MNWVKGFAVVACLATPLSVITTISASADPAAAPAASGAKPAMTEEQKKAKATDCSKQADAKKLHGEARRKFRAQCKKG